MWRSHPWLLVGLTRSSSRPSSSFSQTSTGLPVIPSDLHELHPTPRRAGQQMRKTNSRVREERSLLFTRERERQLSLLPRVEKITVKYSGVPEDAELSMNKLLSTPYNVAQHLSEFLMDRSALALVDGKLWDMHRPLVSDCNLQLLHFHDDDPFHVNRAFWRSCSFMLGAVLDAVFKEDVFVELHSFPPPNVVSGSFVHDVDLKMTDWKPTKEELMTLSAAMHRLAEKELPFECLDVSIPVAQEMFKDNQYKLAQIPNIAANSQSGDIVTVYRTGDHVDISRGPMVGNTGFLGRRCTITVAHPVTQGSHHLYRFQGVALPKNVFLNHFAFGILEQRAAILNTANLRSSKGNQDDGKKRSDDAQ